MKQTIRLMAQKTEKRLDEKFTVRDGDDTLRRKWYTILYVGLFSTVMGIVLHLRPIQIPEPTFGLVTTVGPIVLFLVAWYVGRPLISGYVHTHRTTPTMDEWPSVTVQLPAYNEEANIRSVVESIVSQKYSGDVEIIVVDDGSTDDTWNVLQSLVNEYEDLIAYSKSNSGTASTRQYALERGSNEIVVTMDGDTILKDGALKAMVSEFGEESVVGVASNVEVLNDSENWWTKVQSIEYLVSMEMARTFQSKFRHLMVISGGCGAYRREIVERVGGWIEVDETHAEDFDLTIRAHEHGDIAFTSDAVALTVVPNSLRGWWSQRMGWSGDGFRTVIYRQAVMGNAFDPRQLYGHLKHFLKNREFERSFSLIGLFALPFKLLVSGLLMFSVVRVLYATLQGSALMSMVSVYALSLAITSALALLLLSIVSTFVKHFDPLRKIMILPMYLIIYRQFHVAVRIVAFTDAILRMVYRRVRGKNAVRSAT